MPLAERRFLDAHDPVARRAVEGTSVLAGPAVDAVDLVVAREDRVVAEACVDEILAPAPVDAILAAVAADHVVSGGADQQIVPARAVDRAHVPGGPCRAARRVGPRRSVVLLRA